MQFIHQRIVGASAGADAATPAGPDDADVDLFHRCFRLPNLLFSAFFSAAATMPTRLGLPEVRFSDTHARSSDV